MDGGGGAVGGQSSCLGTGISTEPVGCKAKFGKRRSARFPYKREHVGLPHRPRGPCWAVDSTQLNVFFFFFTTSMNIHNHCYLLSQHFAAYLPSAQNHSHGWKFNLKAFKNVFSLLHIRSANKHFRQEKLILPQTHITLFPHQTSVTNQWCIWYEILTVVHVAVWNYALKSNT